MKIFVSVIAIITGIAVSPVIARADDFTTVLLNSDSSPAAITRCELISRASVGYSGGGWYATLDFYNRASHNMIDATVEYRFYDSDNVQIGKAVSTYTLGETLSPKDTASLSNQDYRNNGIDTRLSEPIVAIYHVTCKITNAHFSGRLFWQSGGAWQGGRLSPAPGSRHEDSASNSSDQYATRGHTASPAAITVALGKAWVTNVPNNQPNSGTFVHVRVTLASPSIVDVWPAEFRMNMTLGNGATKAYSPLQQPAPLVLRGGFLSYSGDPSQLGPSIAPGEDFGAIGKMSLQPNVGVTTVLTYRVDELGGSGSVRSIDVVR